MFKNLKEKLATQVNKTNATLFLGNSSSDSTSRDSTRTASIASRDDTSETNRSRLDSASSDISQFSVGTSPNISYVSPPRTHMPPSDIESEYGGDESEHETSTKIVQMRKLLAVYKNKFGQLKNAYDEVEREKENIKSILQQHQDTSIKRLSDLRDQIKLDRQTKEQLECLHQKEIRLRETKIDQLTQQLTAQNDLIQLPHQTDHDELKHLRDKNAKLEILLNRCKEAIKAHQEKQTELTKDHDNLKQQLNEKEALLESMTKDRHPDEISTEVQQHFNSDISVLLHDKERLQEQLESTRLCVKQLEIDLDRAKQQQPLSAMDDDETKRERDEFKQKYEELQNQIEFFREEILKEQNRCQELEKISADLNLILSNQQMNIKNLTDDLTNVREILTAIERIIVPSDDDSTLIEQIQRLQTANNAFRSLASKETNDQNVLDEIKKQQEILQETLNEENDRHLKEIDRLKTDHENRINELTNELQQTKESMDNLKILLNETSQERTIFKDKYEHAQQQHTDADLKLSEEEIDKLKADIARLQHDYDESVANCTRLTQDKDKQQADIDVNLQQLREENVRLTSRIEEIDHLKNISNENLQEEHRQAIEILKIEFENIQTQQLTKLEDELNAASKRSHEKMTQFSAQIEQKQEEIDRLLQSIDEFKSHNQQLSDELNLLKNQYQQAIESAMQKSEQLTTIQDEFNAMTKRSQDKLLEKSARIEELEKELERKQIEYVAHLDELKAINVQGTDECEHLRETIETSEINKRQQLAEKDKEIEALKRSLSEQQSLYDSLTSEQHEQQTLVQRLHDEHRQNVEKLKFEFEKHQSTAEAQLRATLVEKNEEIDHLHQQLSSQHTQSESYKDQIKHLEETIETLKASETNNHQHLAEKDKEIEALKRSLSEQQSLYDSLTNEQHEQQTLVQRLHDEHRQNVEKLKFEFEKHQSTVEAQLRATLVEKNEEIDHLHQQLSSQHTQSESYKETIETLKASETNNHQHLAEKDKEIEALQQSVSEHRQTIEELKSEFEKYQSAAETKLRTALSEKNDELDALHQQLSSQHSQSESYEDTLEQLRKELQDQKITFSQQRTEIERLLDEQQQFSNSMIRLKNVLGVEATDNDELIEQLVHKMEQSQLIKTENERLNVDLIKQKSHQTHLQNEIRQLEQQLDESKDELNKTTKNLNSTRTKYENECTELNRTVDELRHDRHNLEMALEETRTLLLDKTTEFDQIRVRFDELTVDKDEQLSTSKTQLTDQQTIIDNLRRQINDTNDELKSKANEILSLQTNLTKLQQIIQSKSEEIEQQKKLLLEHKHQNENYAALQIQFNSILTDKAGLENQLDSLRIQMQNTELTSTKKQQDNTNQIEQKIKVLESERDSYRTEMISLQATNEENLRRLADFEVRQLNIEHENNDKDQQLIERNEKIQELELSLHQAHESGTKLRKALHKMKESMTNNEQSYIREAETRLRTLTEEHEKRLEEQKLEYDAKLKAVAKEMSLQIDEKERLYLQQIKEFVDKNNRNENDFKDDREKRIDDAEQRARVAEEETSKLYEQIKEKDLAHYNLVQDLRDSISTLQTQIDTLTTAAQEQQTKREELSNGEDASLRIRDQTRSVSNDSLHSFVFEPTEVDYLRQIVLAYMTGTDRLTMAKVICAVLRYTDDEKTLIIEHEKLRQSRWLNSAR